MLHTIKVSKKAVREALKEFDPWSSNAKRDMEDMGVHPRTVPFTTIVEGSKHVYDEQFVSSWGITQHTDPLTGGHISCLIVINGNGYTFAFDDPYIPITDNRDDKFQFTSSMNRWDVLFFNHKNLHSLAGNRQVYAPFVGLTLQLEEVCCGDDDEVEIIFT